MSQYEEISQTDSVISITGLDEEVLERRGSLPLYDFTERELEIREKWKTMFTMGYLREKIIEARLANKEGCRIAKEKLRGHDIAFRNAVTYRRREALFYECDPSFQTLSIEAHIESLIDPNEIRVFFYQSSDRLEIRLSWNTLTMAMPKCVTRNHALIPIISLPLVMAALLILSIVLKK